MPSSVDIVADAIAWFDRLVEGVQTHSENCHRWHMPCLIRRLVHEIERLRAVDAGVTKQCIEEHVAIESAWERCGIKPHWPDDEPGTTVRYAESMEQEIKRLREERLEVKKESGV